MARRAVPDFIPEPNIEYKLAYKILGKESQLDHDILMALIGGPKRYSELRPLLHGKNNNNLTMALDRLLDDGLVIQRALPVTQPLTFSYELDVLGILVVKNILRMTPMRELFDMLQRAGAFGPVEASA